ncbi:MAG: SpoIID/LytB domain-containing protein [Verrucomicrobiae bacterium]|nr:SpoIID/LytB domain-containing protein [Verrucomicrobiae bacterium]
MAPFLAQITASITLFLLASSPARSEDNRERHLIRVAVVREASALDRTIQSVCKSNYGGNVRVLKSEDGKYTAINTLDVEDYLEGVVGREMSASWPVEALKAQAVAARSHALYSSEQSLNAQYDLVANISQAYRGRDERDARVIGAVRATRGQVLTYKGNLIPAYFHMSCGGRTAAFEEVWPKPVTKNGPELELPGSVVCEACLRHPLPWIADLGREANNTATKPLAAKIGRLVRIEVLGRTPSGRASQLRLVGTSGEMVTSVEKLRALVGYNTMRSGYFEVENTPAGVIFRGSGWGHGVGLCQAGAKEMAERGANYREILAHYFPGAQLAPYHPSLAAVSAQLTKFGSAE